MIRYLRLLRWPNLLIIILTMVLTRYYLIMPVFTQEGNALPMPLWLFACLVLSVVLLAAGGYVINDYFDIRIDTFNDPGRVILGRSVPAKTAIPLHATLSAAGILLGLLVAVYVGNFKLVFVHLLVGLLLWLYSARYKRRPFWGNLVVALASSFVVIVVWLFEFFAMAKKGLFIINQAEFTWVNHSILFLAGFSFLISLVREMIKDIEDQEGDRRYGCRTLPVAIGVGPVRWIVMSLALLSMIILGFVQYHLLGIHLELTAYYFFIIQFMLGYFIWHLRGAAEKDDFNSLSQLARIIMVAGILSMQIYHID